MSKEIELVMDVESKRPACVLLQAAYGCPTYPVHWFDSRHWLVAPTPNMRRIRGTVEQFKAHAERLNATRSPTQ